MAWWLSKRASQLGQNLIDDSILFKGFLQGRFSATVGGFCVFDSLSEIELHLVKLAVRLHVTYLSKASSVLLVFFCQVHVTLYIRVPKELSKAQTEKIRIL